MRLLLTKLNLFQSNQQYAFIKTFEYNLYAKAVTNNIAYGREFSEAISLSHKLGITKKLESSTGRCNNHYPYKKAN